MANTVTGSDSMLVVKPWDWRRSEGGWTLPTDRGPKGRAFHAYDVNDSAACSEHLGLIASVEPPNEGSYFCPDCIEVVKAMPGGRPKRMPGER